MSLLDSQASTRKKNPIMNYELHCKFLPHENYGDWELPGPCRESLHFLWKKAVRIARKPHDNYRTYSYHRVSPQILQLFSIDSADFPCRDPAIPSPRSFQGCKNLQCRGKKHMKVQLNTFIKQKVENTFV